MEKEFEYEFTDEIVCPYCGHEHIDSWEQPDEVDSFDCHECFMDFKMKRNVEITYSTYKK